MESATFRKWLAERGCRFDHHEEKRGDGQVTVTVHREGRKAEVPLGGSRQIIRPIASSAVLAGSLNSTGPSCLDRKAACEMCRSVPKN